MSDFDSNEAFANINEMGGVDYTNMNKGVTPLFFTLPVKDERQTEKQGKAVFIEQEMVKIVVAGDGLSAPTHPVDDGLRARFSAQYEKWKRDKVAKVVVGTSIKAWPLLSQIQVAEFESVNIFSVEDLAALSDENTQRVSDGRAWRAKAEAWLASVKDGAASARYAAENERLTQRMAEMERDMKEMRELLDEKTAPDGERRGPGRPRKEAA